MNIYVVDVHAAGMETRVIRLAKAEREPAHAYAETSTESKSDAPVLASQEAHKRGTIEGALVNRTRAPAPAASDVLPAAIVIRREAPRLIPYPSPTPRANPVPIAVAIGSPAHVYNSWVPDVAIFGFFVPSAVVVQVRPAGDILRDVSRGC